MKRQIAFLFVLCFFCSSIAFAKLIEPFYVKNDSMECSDRKIKKKFHNQQKDKYSPTKEKESFVRKSNQFIPYLYIGPTGGLTLSKFFFNPSIRQSLLSGYTAGIAVRLDVESYAGLQIECNYFQSGWKERYPFDPEKGFTHRIDFIQVPILTNIHYRINNLRFTLCAGPEFGGIISEDTFIKNNSNADTYTDREKQRFALRVQNKFAWGIVAGVGASYHIQKVGVFGCSVRGYFGFQDVFHVTRSDLFGNAAPIQIEAKLFYLIPLFRIKY